MIKFNVKNISALSIVFFILLYFRRGSQLLYPNIWNEDGAFNIISFLNNGWLNLLEPVQGYLITIPKLITNISMSISFIYYPEISTYITWLFTVFVALVVVYAPTKLEYSMLAAIMIFLIPTNAEAYGLPLYTLWFSTIFLFLVALWEPNKKQVLKNVLLTMGGLSSPTIILMIPIQIYRSIFLQSKKEEIVSLVLAIIMTVIQLSFIMKTGAKSNIPHIDMAFVETIITKFFGMYYLGGYSLSKQLLLLGGLYIFGIMSVYMWQNKKDTYFYILVFMLFATMGLSSVRVDPSQFQPMVGGGARYFFFPYILLSWILLYIMKKNRYYEIAIAPVLILSIIVALQHFCKLHDDLEWKKRIVECQNANGRYVMPVHYDGDKRHAWHIRLESTTCKKLIENDLFQLPNKIESSK